MTEPPSTPEFGAAYTTYQTQRSTLRKLVRQFFLRHAASFCRGRVLDFGCGVGELLRRLPAGSRGLEVNPFTVRHCQENGLDVELYDPAADKYRLAQARHGEFQTLVVSHVLEHLPDPQRVLRALLATCRERAIGRLVMIVPGAAGFASDPTHKTFITAAYLRTHGFFDEPHAKLTHIGYFPINCRRLGDYLRHHEMTAVFDIAPIPA
jgi:SAM-dependent methyltransferase